MRDPHVPDQKQYHYGVFVRTRKNGSRILYYAVRDVTSQGGIRYEAKERDDVIRLQTFNSQQPLGYILAPSYPLLEQILRSCQTLPQQKAFNIRRIATKLFKSLQPLTFYTDNELKNFDSLDLESANSRSRIRLFLLSKDYVCLSKILLARRERSSYRLPTRLRQVEIDSVIQHQGRFRIHRIEGTGISTAKNRFGSKRNVASRPITAILLLYLAFSKDATFARIELAVKVARV